MKVELSIHLARQLSWILLILVEQGLSEAGALNYYGSKLNRRRKQILYIFSWSWIWVETKHIAKQQEVARGGFPIATQSRKRKLHYLMAFDGEIVLFGVISCSSTNTTKSYILNLAIKYELICMWKIKPQFNSNSTTQLKLKWPSDCPAFNYCSVVEYNRIFARENHKSQLQLDLNRNWVESSLVEKNIYFFVWAAVTDQTKTWNMVTPVFSWVAIKRI